MNKLYIFVILIVLFTVFFIIGNRIMYKYNERISIIERGVITLGEDVESISKQVITNLSSVEKRLLLIELNVEIAEDKEKENEKEDE